MAVREKSAAYRARIEQRITRMSHKLRQLWTAGRRPRPSLRELTEFLYWRTIIRFEGRRAESLDYHYWRDKGWLTGRFYAAVPASRAKSIAASYIVAFRLARIAINIHGWRSVLSALGRDRG